MDKKRSGTLRPQYKKPWLCTNLEHQHRGSNGDWAKQSHCTRSWFITIKWTGNSRDMQAEGNNVQSLCKPSSAYLQLLHINPPVNTYFSPSGTPIKLENNQWLDLQTHFPTKSSVSMKPINLGKQLHTKVKIRNFNEHQALFSGWIDTSYLTVCIRNRERLIWEEG